MISQPLRGDTVVIYEDPMTETKPEGEARLVSYISSSPVSSQYELQDWYVCFAEEPGRKVRRRVAVYT